MAGLETAALVAVDIQNDFCPGGALAVDDGHVAAGVANRLAPLFGARVLTQDWHPPDHMSFASNRPGGEPFKVIKVGYGDQILWPDHCVQGTSGAAFHPELETRHADLVIRKGFRREIDSYSTFFENDHRTPTGLAGYLRDRGFERIFLVGLATDFCVKWSAVDGRRLGFAVTVVEDGCRGIDLDGSLEAAMREMAEAGVEMVTSDRLG